MRRLEDLINRLSDIDASWWPVVSLRPPKDKQIDNKVLLQISPIFGPVMGLVIFLCLVVVQFPTGFTLSALFGCMLLGIILFFIFYKVSVAYFWNRRAKRLQSAPLQSTPST